MRASELLFKGFRVQILDIIFQNAVWNDFEDT